ncbi:transcriptional regulator [Kitasatospora sp. NPDC002227]|uniref:transcriptional regulator n=1 Tax=Kitasatospora sp. NPDC002227 TaxID=3154773 RepID=UPI00331E71D8
MAATSARELYDRIRIELGSSASELGSVDAAVLRRIAGEEYRIIRSDRRSFALLAARFAERGPAGSFFLGLAAGEGEALGLLGPYAAAVGLPPEELAAYRPAPAAQCYPHYLAWLAQFGTLSQTVLALLANFPSWSVTCARLADTVGDEYGPEAAAFFRFFAELPPDFEPTTLALLRTALDEGESADDAAEAARLLQAYERSFWAAVR